ncbi:hypothetical protein SARC_01874 [Sphaeroforma arctica JP610]|uniref:HCNGP-like protein n=1 Tax=Sphaeroforma arctica JP610 TaxID=667725 RepID=A0A0L0GAF3_9EUKA|nr:hypothetical protein SARC_01874 [Sphaeroforma arctica JP610]KNC85970.1 hypothetical protein SARC_01874 [Sphaeroforma arctica JP610]|eukprot:XP_014159872.1 hypothetical protein SARC_01874 [Sphaeroforma arctica JP610]
MASLSALVGYGGGESDSDSASTPVSPQSTEGDVVLVGAEGSKDTQQSNEGDGVLVGSSASAEGKERDQKDMDSTAGVDGSPNGVDASLKRSALDDEENADSDGDYPFACKKIKLPPPVVGEVDMELNERITKYITLSKDKGRNFNARLRTNKNFQNPHICEVLVQQLGLNETQSMCAKHIFDPAEFDDKGCYYQDLCT